MENAKVPCIQTGTGICHIFVDESADLDCALDIIENAKASRPSVCNAEEVCLVHQAIAPLFLPRLAQRLGADRIAQGLPPYSCGWMNAPPGSSPVYRPMRRILTRNFWIISWLSRWWTPSSRP